MRERPIRTGNYLQTHSGIKFYPFDPAEEDISILDIAHALANICRFTGHTKHFYSVAQHSVLCSEYVEPELALHALLHDATEAYLGDVARPIKIMSEMDFYRKAEDRLDEMIRKVFGLDPDHSQYIHHKIKEVDNRVLYTEKRDVLAIHVSWPWRIEPYEEKIIPLCPETAKAAFMSRFKELRYGRMEGQS